MNKNPDSDLTLKSSLQGLDPANYSRSNFTRPLKNATTVYFGYIFKCFKYFLFFIVFLKVDILLDIGRREYSGAWQYQPTLDNRQYRRTLTIHPTTELEVVNWRLLQSLLNGTGVFTLFSPHVEFEHSNSGHFFCQNCTTYKTIIGAIPLELNFFYILVQSSGPIIWAILWKDHFC